MILRALPFALALTCLAPAPAPAGPWQVAESIENGIPVVANPGRSRDGETARAAVERWRLGADEENDPLLGRITDVIVDAEDRAYLLDANLSDILVVGPAGGVLRTIGGEGDGPGEFRNASRLAFVDGGDIAVMEMMPGNVVVMDPHGEPRPGFRPGGDEGPAMMLPQNFAADDRGLVLGHVATSFGGDVVVTEHVLGRYSRDGELLATLAETREEQEGGNLSLSLGDGEDDFVRRWSLGADGRVVGYRYAFDYELQVYAPDGSLARIIRRDYETRRRPDEEIAAERRRAEEQSRRFSGMTMEVEERARDIREVHPRPGGMLWVATSEGAAARSEGSLDVFDVFDAGGRYVNTLRVTGVEYDPARDEYVLEGNHLFVFRESRMVPPKTTTSGGGGMQMVMISGSGPDPADEGDSGPLEVVCYELAE